MAEAVARLRSYGASEVLVKDSAVSSGIERQVEWIKKELELMLALSKHMEHHSSLHNKAGFEEELNHIGRDAIDAIETYVIKSDKRRRRAIPYLVDRYRVGKELRHITKRMKRISQKILDSYEHEQASSVAATPLSDTIVVPAVKKLDSILREHPSAAPGAEEATASSIPETRKTVEDARDELVTIQNIVSKLELPTNKREDVWLEQVRRLCDSTVEVVDGLIARTTRCGLPAPRIFQTRFGDKKNLRQMEDIRSHIRDVLRRRVTYGVGGESTSSIPSAPSLSLAPLMNFPIISRFISSDLLDIFLPSLGLLLPSSKDLKSIRKDLDLMHALLSDVELEGLDERQKVWVEQLSCVAKHARSLTNSHRKATIFKRIVVAQRIPLLLNQIHEMTRRKTTYDIANMQSIHNRNIICVQPPAPMPRLPKNGREEIVLSIKCEKQLMEALAQDLEKVGELDGVSNIWKEEMKSIESEMESIINEYARIEQHKYLLARFLSNPRFFLELSRRNYNIRRELDEASRRRATYRLVQFETEAESLSKYRVLPRVTHPVINVRSRAVGFWEDIETLKTELLSDEKRRSVTSILGIKGTGKKKLAHLIFEDDAVKNEFPCRVFVPKPSDGTKVEQLVDYVANQAAEQINPTEQDVFTTLASTKYLIVLDGVETSSILDALKKKIPDKLTGSRILLTSRKLNVKLHASKTSYVHALRLLDDDESWMLVKITLNNGARSKELEPLKGEIVKICCGLPSAILKMKDFLSQKKVPTKDSLKQEHDQNPWPETLETLNTNLPLYLRRCLSYFLLFHADYDIPVRRLVVLWVAERLVHSGDDKETPEQVAERYLNELIDLNMVQIARRKPNGKVKACRLPRALRKSLTEKPNESSSLTHHPIGNPNAVPRKSRILHVADHLKPKDTWHQHIHQRESNIDPASLQGNYQDVLSFLSFDYREGSEPGQQIGNFLNQCILSECFMLLRVLDLERVYKPHLPKNISRLSRLRYLGLRRTFLESLPSSISKLLKLQTLDLKRTYIPRLTSSIWKMELRHLFLSETYRTRFPRPPKDKKKHLSDLQTLWGLFVDERTRVKGGLDKLENIRKLGVACQSMFSRRDKMKGQLDSIAAWITKLESLQTLRLKSRDEEGQPWILRLNSLEKHNHLTDIYLQGTLTRRCDPPLFPEGLVQLTLSHSRLKDDPMHILKDLPNLRLLYLLAESYVGQTSRCSSNSFIKLQVLKLWKLEQLQEWHIEDGSLPSLTQLEIRSCWCLKKLLDGLKDLKTLLELKLTDMPKYMGADDEQDNIPPNCEVFRRDFEDNHPAHT